MGRRSGEVSQMTGNLFLDILIIAIIVLVIAGAVFLVVRFGDFESPQRRAGRLGEQYATRVISEVLNEGDALFTNVGVYADDKETELDNVIVNSRGVFIIEVKNYSGELYGYAGDYEWLQTKYSSGGNFYQKMVRNPIKQVNRQVHILSCFLKENDINVWIEGYAILTEHNAPFSHRQILENQYDIDRAVHPKDGQKLSKGTRKRIVELLEQLINQQEQE